MRNDFQYVVLRHSEIEAADQYAGYLPLESAYQDSDLTAFKLADLRYQPPCPTTHEQVKDLPSLEISTSIG